MNHPESTFKAHRGHVKFTARDSQDQEGMVDMVVDLKGGRTEKVFAPKDDNFLAGYSKGDEVIVLELPQQGGGRFTALAENFVTAEGDFSPLTEADLKGASELAGQYVEIIKDMYRQMLGEEELSEAHLDKETARQLATTAFIQTFR